MPYDLYLQNALIVTESSSFLGGIVIHNGKIEQIVGKGLLVDAKETIDLEGKIILPGLVDSHVHFNEPGRTHWEGYETGSMAAAAGGVTTVLEMPLNATPPTIDKNLLFEKREIVKNKPVVDYANWGGLVDNNVPELTDMHAAGVIGFKAFLSDSSVDFARIDDDVLYAGLVMSRELRTVIGLHAENEYIAKYFAKTLKDSGRIDRASWYESRPPEGELEAIKRACYWAKVTKGNLHVVHISIPEGIREIYRAKDEGVNVTSETCPHFLFFDQEDFIRIGPSAKCAPPIRSRDTVNELWDCVLKGLVDVIASDHSPCTWEEKAAGLENIWKAWGGIQGIQGMLPVILTEGVHKRGLELTDIARMMSFNPARIFGLYPKKGAILPGSDADLVVVDLDKEWTFDENMILSKNKHSAYIGSRFKGKVIRTIVRGETVFMDDKIVCKPGYGQLQQRQN
jgi:allantoinase